MKIIGKYNNITQVINKSMSNNDPNTYPCGTPDNTQKAMTVG